ncbi:MAG: D-tyrosyl-tRNA(Tyr) deacylase [Actinobacteria bacterium]|nr:D-tyrosyl-tRNA(Tyr) deacylase [Actinomycetota bacterium]
MRVVLQRVTRAAVRVTGDAVAEIGRGLVLLVGVGAGDARHEPDLLAHKVFHLRVFEDGEGKMNLALSDVGGEVLVVPQFTLYGDIRKGRRPSWVAAAPPELAAERVEELAAALERLGARVSRGVFGEHMEVELVNDGPVTLTLDAAELPGGGAG